MHYFEKDCKNKNKNKKQFITIKKNDDEIFTII